MSWYVDFTCKSKERAAELIDGHFEQTRHHNPEWELLAGAAKVLTSILPDPGKNNMVHVWSSGHATLSPLSNSGRAEMKVELVSFVE